MENPERDKLPAVIEGAFSLTPEERQLKDRLGVAIGQLGDMLDFDGAEQAINGEQLIVSQTSLQIKDSAENPYFARAFRRQQKEGSDNSTSVEYGILYDHTEDTSNIVVTTPDIVRLRQKEGFLPEVVLLPENTGAVELNDSEAIEHVLDLSKNLHRKAQEANQEETRLSEYHRRERRENRRGWIKFIAGTTIGTAALTGAVYGISKIDFEEIFRSQVDTFDDNGYDVGQAEVIDIGETAHPSFSDRLYNQPGLDREYVPLIAGSKDTLPAGYKRKTDSITTDREGATALRQIIIGSSEEGKNCELYEFKDKVSLGAKLIIASDFAAPDGTSRAEELDVSMTTETIEVCWNGQERNDNDDPRVVVELLD